MNLKIWVNVVVLIVGAALGFFGARTYERAQCAKRAESVALESTAQTDSLHRGAEQWADSLAKAEGEAVIRSFAAGLAPVVLAGRPASVDIAGASLLRLRGVQGVTILRADGKVLYASNAKLTVSETGTEQTRWAMAAKDFMIRESVQPGIAEMSLPVTDRGSVLAVVWLAYDPALIREQWRPQSLGVKANAPAAE